MKNAKLKTWLFCILVIVFCGHVQIVFGQTWNQGGNATITDERLGTGTSTGANLRIITNGTERMRIASGGNIGIGTTTPGQLFTVVGGNIDLASPTQQYLINGLGVLWHNNDPSSIYLGIGACNLTSTGVENTYLGPSSGTANTSGSHNTFTGYWAGTANTIGNENTFVGVEAGVRNTTGIQNTFVGGYSGWSIATASENTMMGYYSGYQSTGTQNTFLGNYTGRYTTGRENTMLGYHAGYLNTSGNFNINIGTYAGNNNSTGHNNICIGNVAGPDNWTGNDNIFVGRDATCLANNLDNAIAIGAMAQVDGSNCMVLGSINGTNGATSTIKVGIGTTAPATRLEVNNISAGSGLRLTQLTASSTAPTSTTNKALTVNSTGYLPICWAA